MASGPDELSDMNDLWVNLPSPPASAAESMSDRARRVSEDLEDLNNYYNLSLSSRRHKRFSDYFTDEMDSLFKVDFDALNQQDKVDFLLLRGFLQRNARNLDLEWAAGKKIAAAVPFAPVVIALSEARQDVKPMVGEQVARQLNDIRLMVAAVQNKVHNGKIKMTKVSGYRAVKVIKEFRERLRDVATFYSTYDPSWDWWVTTPYKAADLALEKYIPIVEKELAGMHPDAQDEIVGEPIGRDGLLVELEAEMISYSPEELIDLANDQFQWSEKQMKIAAKELGYGDNWKAALEHVKIQFVPPGEQPKLALDLALDGAKYVKENDLVTVPRLADETYRMFMMTPEAQKVAPVFLGGPVLQVSYPTKDMPHGLKMMVMRSNNKYFAKATVFHELIPGHRLQLFMAKRYNSHRWMYATPFVVEGWGVYWEMHLWDRGDFFASPEDRIGTLFWRMHRCARIIFSLKFHLGQMNPQEIIDKLVSWVGHERFMAESEVRRWFNGEWAPLYQCGYMLGALELVALRKEALSSGKFKKEKEFNDAVLKANFMPIELMRALLLGLELKRDYKTKWRFYDFKG